MCQIFKHIVFDYAIIYPQRNIWIYIIVEPNKEDLEIIKNQKNLRAFIMMSLINKNISATDIRALAPLRELLSEGNIAIKDLISRIRNAKNIRLFVAYFRIQNDYWDYEKMREKFEKIVGKQGIHSLEVKNYIGIIELNEEGKRKLIESAKKQNLTLRKFVNKLVNE